MVSEPIFELLVALVLPAAVGLVWLFVAQFLHPGQELGDGPHAPTPADSSPRVRCDQLGIVTLADAFDPERHLLWQAQVAALEQLASGARMAQMARLWEPMRACPELYDGRSCADWVRFLQQLNFIVVTGEQVRLTEEGHEFLRCFHRHKRRWRQMAG